MKRSYSDYISRGKQEHGDKFSDSQLDRRFVPFYESGERIKVICASGETITGTVGATTGWRPCFLLMRTSRSIGSMWTLSGEDKIVGVKVGRTYVHPTTVYGRASWREAGVTP